MCQGASGVVLRVKSQSSCDLLLNINHYLSKRKNNHLSLQSHCKLSLVVQFSSINTDHKISTDLKYLDIVQRKSCKLIFIKVLTVS